MRQQQLQRADGIGLAPAERRAARPGQGFRQHEQAVEPVDQGQARRHPERQARIDAAEQTAERRADHESDAEGRADQAEVLRPFLRRGDVGDIGSGRGEAGGGDARDQPSDVEPAERRRRGHDQIVAAQTEDRDQQHRTAPEPVRQRTDDGRGDELHQRPAGGEDLHIVQRLGRRASGHGLDQVRQHRDDDAERDHVHQRGGEDEAEGGGAAGAADDGWWIGQVVLGHGSAFVFHPGVRPNPVFAQCAERTLLKAPALPSALGALMPSNCAISGCTSTLSNALIATPFLNAGPSATNTAAISGVAGS